MGCEFSGRVRDAFILQGHNLQRCDLVKSDSPGPHIIGDLLSLLNDPLWDMLIAFPPCTHLCVSGAKHFKRKRESGEQQAGIAFFSALWNCRIPRICLENPVGIMSSIIGKPAQIIQPWQFGHGETKATCLFLKNLPLLKPSKIVQGREARIHNIAPGPDRAKIRSTTYQGIADAMAEQWGGVELTQEQLTLF